MATLYLVALPESLETCAHFADDEDVVVLIGHGTQADLSKLRRPVYLLSDAKRPTDVVQEPHIMIGYSEFVDLVTQCSPIVNWR